MAKVTEIMHPEHQSSLSDWKKFRLTLESGNKYLEEYLRRFSHRESTTDFENRKAVSYVAAFAKSALIDIKNALSQKLPDVKRVGGPLSYQLACNGYFGGVDRRGNTMNGFVSRFILLELLGMGRVGIYIDRTPKDEQTTRANKNLPPYLYIYTAEQIKSWTYDEAGNLTKLLVEAEIDKLDETTGLPEDTEKEYRFFTLENETVTVTFYDEGGAEKESKILDLPEIPFVLVDIEQPLLKDIADYQIALTNLASSDITWSLKSNRPFYTEQRHPDVTDFSRQGGEPFAEDDTAPAGTNTAKQADNGNDRSIETGTIEGRTYRSGLERPGFIAPPDGPLRVSMEKQGQMKEDIRLLVNLNLTNVKSARTSAESKREDWRTKEEGLANIGAEIEFAERSIARIWALYDGSEAAQISYPNTYSMRSDEERRQEAKDLLVEATKVSSKILKTEIAKQAVELLIGSSVPLSKLEEIFSEIENSNVPIAIPDQIQQDLEDGLLDVATASKAKNYPESSIEQAKIDHAERLARIAKAQGGFDTATGVDKDSQRNAADERRFEQARDFNTSKNVRGKANGVSSE